MAWMGLGSIIAIIGIVIVAGSIIAVIGKLLLNTFDGENKSKVNRNADVIDYQQYKELEAGKTQNVETEYNFEQINMAKANHEKELLEANKEELKSIVDESDGDLEEIENRLKAESLEVKEDKEEMIDIDDIDVMSLVDEISDDVVEEQKVKTTEEVAAIDPILANMNIDEYLNKTEEDVEEDQIDEEAENIIEEVVEEVEAESTEEEKEEAVLENEKIEEEIAEEILTDIEDEIVEDIEKDVVDTQNIELLKANEQIEILKAQLLEVNSKLEEARNTRPAVTIDMTEEECLARLAILEDRLKNVKKDYKINLKEYKPLKKIMKDYERYQTKLRRKDAVVAKKKVDLYGVNNYVDIDKEKAEKLANELELLDGLRLSVSHCEEVINANKERFPILEHTNKILEEQIANIESDIEVTNITLQRIRDKKGNGDSQNGENQE